MKKIIKYLLLTILFIPCIIKADMGAPMIRPYEMVVTNPNGIDYYGYDNNMNEVIKGHLNKDDTFTVEYEYDTVYNIIINKNEYASLHSLDGTIPLKDEIKPEIEVNNSNENTAGIIKAITSNNEALVYADEGVDIKKGPAKGYTTIGHIEKGKTIKYNYYYDDGTGIISIYVDYNGIKGWVEILNTKVLIENDKQLIAKNDYNLGCTTIPKNTIISPKYTADAWSRKVLVEYNNCTKLYDKLNDSNLITLSNDDSEQGTANTEIDIYEFYNNGGTKIATIPNNATFIVLGIANERGEEEADLYVQYENNRGWIHTSHNNYVWNFNNDDPSEITIPNTTPETTANNATIGPTKPETTNKTPIDYITTYIILCSVIVIMAIIIIILINKNKNNKKEIKNEKEN